MSRLQTLLCAVSLLVTLATVNVSQAVTISSTPFSIGMGFIRTGTSVGVWDTSETAAANTPTVSGDFSFLPTVSSGMFSNSGPLFGSRNLINGNSTGGQAASYRAASDEHFSASVTGNWAGVLDTALYSHAEIRVNVDSVRIWAVGHTSFTDGNPTIAWNEDTAGLEASSTALGLTFTGTTTTASNFTQLIWDPADDFFTGTSHTRTFSLLADDVRGLDGFEIFGSVDVMLVPHVPEPASSTMLAIAGCLFVFRKRQRRGLS